MTILLDFATQPFCQYDAWETFSICARLVLGLLPTNWNCRIKILGVFKKAFTSFVHRVKISRRSWQIFFLERSLSSISAASWTYLWFDGAPYQPWTWSIGAKRRSADLKQVKIVGLSVCLHVKKSRRTKTFKGIHEIIWFVFSVWWCYLKRYPKIVTVEK